jgi:UDPglucose 6-dehydrogenase
MKTKFFLFFAIFFNFLFARPLINIIGTGYVGLVNGVCLSELGFEVICSDIDKDKIEKLKKSEISFYEPELKQLVRKNLKNKRLNFTTDIPGAIKNSDIIFIAVGTPMQLNGDADLSYINKVIEVISENLNNYKTIVIKSTVPIGSCVNFKKKIKEKTSQNFDIISNPEFLREGSAVFDFFNPDRIVIGSDNKDALTNFKKFYTFFENKEVPFLLTDLYTSETIKYASNAFLAMKISFINEMDMLCDLSGANIKDVSKGIGLDKRIGEAFLKPGPGFGGSCFPKDVNALLQFANNLGLDFKLIKATLESNASKKQYVINKIISKLGNDCVGKRVALIGLAFKEGTDDIRGTPSLDIIKALITKGIKVVGYDPLAVKKMQIIFPEVEYSDSLNDKIFDVDLIVILNNCFDLSAVKLDPSVIYNTSPLQSH